MKSISTPAIVTSIRAKVDHSLSFSVSTPELDNTEKVAFMELQGMNTTMTIVPLDELNVLEMKVKGDLEQKTPSQRLRNVLYILWKQGHTDTDFEEFYKKQMETIIGKVKEKLESEDQSW